MAIAQIFDFSAITCVFPVLHGLFEGFPCTVAKNWPWDPFFALGRSVFGLGTVFHPICHSLPYHPSTPPGVAKNEFQSTRNFVADSTERMLLIEKLVGICTCTPWRSHPPDQVAPEVHSHRESTDMSRLAATSIPPKFRGGGSDRPVGGALNSCRATTMGDLQMCTFCQTKLLTAFQSQGQNPPLAYFDPGTE